ncbi:hypothetical protein GOV14_00945 [Candidatus Pacearchaeota archaeon]|nr:hypothetical protein [Candidatus Pacearchaeota archaeon]
MVEQGYYIPDGCIDDTRLAERICANNQLSSEVYSCPSKCNNTKGACN